MAVPVEDRISFDVNLLPLEGDNLEIILAWLDNEYGYNSDGAYRIKKYCAKYHKIIIRYLIDNTNSNNNLWMIHSWLYRMNRYDFNGPLFDYIFADGDIQQKFKEFSIPLLISDIYPNNSNNSDICLMLRKVIIDYHYEDSFMAVFNMEPSEFYEGMPEEYQLNILL